MLARAWLSWPARAETPALAPMRVAPARIIKGNRTGLANPSGVFVDKKNHELWVSNFGNSSASAYPLTANGNESATAGKRMVVCAARGSASSVSKYGWFSRNHAVFCACAIDGGCGFVQSRGLRTRCCTGLRRDV